MKKMKRFMSVALSAVMALGLWTAAGPAFAADETQPAQPANPVYDSASDSTDWDFVYFGTYPQEEVTGDALTDAIKNADYDKTTGLATVDGVTYKKLSKSAVTYKRDGFRLRSTTGTIRTWHISSASLFAGACCRMRATACICLRTA